MQKIVFTYPYTPKVFPSSPYVDNNCFRFCSESDLVQSVHTEKGRFRFLRFSYMKTVVFVFFDFLFLPRAIGLTPVNVKMRWNSQSPADAFYNLRSLLCSSETANPWPRIDFDVLIIFFHLNLHSFYLKRFDFFLCKPIGKNVYFLPMGGEVTFS